MAIEATPHAGEIAVITQKLKKVYGLGTGYPVEALHCVDMQVMAGEFVSIIGQSGSGKSTLLNMLGALDVPTEGTVTIGGRDISKLDRNGLAKLRNESIGFVFQFHYLLPDFTCLENCLIPLMIKYGSPPKEERDRVKNLLEQVGLGDQLRKRPSEMSGGQQQRAAIIRALANRPNLALADEPTGNLDARTGAEVFDLLRTIIRETGVAFIMVTHDDRLARAADRMLKIEFGEISEVKDLSG